MQEIYEELHLNDLTSQEEPNPNNHDKSVQVNIRQLLYEHQEQAFTNLQSKLERINDDIQNVDLSFVSKSLGIKDHYLTKQEAGDFIQKVETQQQKIIETQNEYELYNKVLNKKKAELRQKKQLKQQLLKNIQYEEQMLQKMK
ncbi:Hypothetical_protein [Hexamita inflata]|uniref:Hypothetical_protein n=1 Tax=Hexamita inflata TaxID=28002 RepID=A0AA86PG78_9EUKA|nr:Hypothetical protein HINF_LOCUS25271 [Hexamita inflata]CAI9944504.1 Hypothetical protein HINF_LOCUS32149 [Hexamita inflata]